MRDRMLAGELYIADDPDLIRENERAQRLTHAINTADPTGRERRCELLTELLGGFGEDSAIRPPLHVDYFGLVILNVATVTIGDDVQIGPYVQLLTATHPLEPGPRRDKWESAEPIVLPRQRLARRRRHRVPRGHHRREHRGRRRLDRHARPAGGGPRCRHACADHPRALTHARPAPGAPSPRRRQRTRNLLTTFGLQPLMFFARTVTVSLPRRNADFFTV